MTRTCDLQVRNLTLYPTELWAPETGGFYRIESSPLPLRGRRGGGATAIEEAYFFGEEPTGLDAIVFDALATTGCSRASSLEQLARWLERPVQAA